MQTPVAFIGSVITVFATIFLHKSLFRQEELCAKYFNPSPPPNNFSLLPCRRTFFSHVRILNLGYKLFISRSYQNRICVKTRECIKKQMDRFENQSCLNISACHCHHFFFAVLLLDFYHSRYELFIFRSLKNMTSSRTSFL